MTMFWENQPEPNQPMIQMLSTTMFWNKDDVFSVNQEDNHKIYFKMVSGIFVKQYHINKLEEGRLFKYLRHGKTNYYKEN